MTLKLERDERGAAADVHRFVSGQFGSAARRRRPRNNRGPVHPKASLQDFRSFFGRWDNGKRLLGTAGSWLLLDIAFVGFSDGPLLISSTEWARDGQPRSGPDRDLVRPIGLDRLDRDRTGPTFRFGLGLISMIQMSVLSYYSLKTIGSASVRSKRFGPIGPMYIA